MPIPYKERCPSHKKERCPSQPRFFFKQLLLSVWTPDCENRKFSQSHPNVSVSEYLPRKVGAVIALICSSGSHHQRLLGFAKIRICSHPQRFLG